MKQRIPQKATYLFVLVLIVLISLSVLGRSLNNPEKTMDTPVPDTAFEMKNRVQISDQEFDAVVANEPAQSSAMMDTSIFSSLTMEDLSKIEDPAFLSFVTQIRAEKSASTAAKTFKVFIKYQEDEREKLERLLGQSEVEEIFFYRFLNLVSIQTSGDILANVLKEGEDTVISVNTDSVNEISDILPANEISTVTLGGGTEEITEVSRLHQAGYTGKGSTIAILDTGLDASHAEFGDRVIYEKCFSTKFGEAGTDSAYYLPLCKDQKLTADSAYPYSDYPQTVTHGSHVAGIAAGKGGMAPEANIIAVQVFSQYLYKDQSGTRWATTAAFDSDYLKGLDYIYGLAQEGVPIAAVNLSLGSGEFYAVCDDSDRLGISTLFRKLNELGIVVVTAAGNSGTAKGYDGWISAPACYSGSFTVGALDYHAGKPKIADFSSYNDLVDLLAPGTNIHSACLSDYCEKSGTSMAAPAVTGAIALVKGNFQGASGLDAAAFLQNISAVSYQKSGVSRKSLNFHKVLSEETGTELRADAAVPISLKAPSSVQAVPGNQKVALQWKPVEGADGYQIFCSDSSEIFGICALAVGENTTTAEVSELSDGTSLKNGMRYDFYLKPYQEVIQNGQETIIGGEAISKKVSGKPMLPAPSQIAAITDSGMITLTWDAVPAAGNYQIAYSRYRFWGFQDSEPITGTRFPLDGLKEGEKIYFKVRSMDAVNPDVKSDYSAVISAAALESAAPTIPGVLSDRENAKDSEIPTIAAMIPDEPVMVNSSQKSIDPQRIDESENADLSGNTAEPLLTDQKAWRWDMDRLPSTGFPAGRLVTLPVSSSDIPYQNLGFSIEIPAIDSRSQIVSVPARNAQFAVDWLGKDAGLLQGSDLPGKGISIIAAHNHLNTGETGPFLFLMDLKQNDRIFIRNAAGDMQTFKIYANQKIAPDEIEKMDALAKTNCLILVTCEDESSDGGYTHRRVVFAEPFESN